MNSTALSSYLLELYEKARTMTPDQYKNWLFDSFHHFFSFDNAIWMNLSSTGNPIGVHLHRLPVELIQEYVEHYQEKDIFLEKIAAQPGKVVRGSDVVSDTELLESEIQQEFYSKYGMVRGLSYCHQGEEGSGNFNIYFNRADFSAKFTDEESEFIELVMPHFIEGSKHNLEYYLFSAFPKLHNHSIAICDRDGAVILQQSSFARFIAKEWPEISSSNLPEIQLPSPEEMQGEKRHVFSGRQITIECEPLLDLVVVHVSLHDKLQFLTYREKEIALLLYNGLSNKEIGKDLDISPKTVSNHVSNILSKLDISRRQQIAGFFTDE
jgi:DNA-binding CsgD family transcriptional regulator